MSQRSTIAEDVIGRQERMLRLAERDHGLSAVVLKAETGIPKDTILSWRRGVAMPAWALVALARVIPDELTTLMFEPVEKVVMSGHDGDGDLDLLAREMADYNVEYLNARDPRSEDGAALSPRGRAILKEKASRVAATARRAAA